MKFWIDSFNGLKLETWYVNRGSTINSFDKQEKTTNRKWSSFEYHILVQTKTSLFTYINVIGLSLADHNSFDRYIAL